MSILDEILTKVEKSELDEQLKVVCDQIMTEETEKFTDPNDQPQGPNIFLAIQFSDKNNISFLCLERELKEKYIVSLWSKKRSNKINETIAMKRKKVWEVTEVKVEKILKFYAETLKYVRGE
jgi:hypothetical protein